MIQLTQLQLLQKNPRKISPVEMDKLKKSIQQAPWMMELRPIIVDQEWVILAGSQRYKAMLELQMKEIPENWVHQVTQLSQAQKDEFLIKDNTHAGEWDWTILAASDWNDKSLEDWGLDIPELDIDLGNAISTTRADVAKINYKTWKVGLTKKEETALDAALEEYKNSYGSMVGFVHRVLRLND